MNANRMGGRAIVVTLLSLIGGGMMWLLWARTRAMSRPTPAVALLPFEASSADAPFADGLAIELINALSKVEKLKVVSWNRAVSFRGKPGQLKELREQLQAGSVVEGSLRRRGDRLYVTVKLVDTNTGESIWRDTLDRPQREVFDIQERIAKGVVYALNVPMRVDPQRILVPPRTASNAAYENYLQARALQGKSLQETLSQSSAFALKAIADDPRFSPGYALLAANYGFFGGMTSENLAKAKEFATKAIAMDSSSGEAHAALGLALGLGNWDWPGARVELERAVQWSPGSADAHAALALGYLMPTNDLEGAEYEARKALELDSLSVYANAVAGRVLMARNKRPEALERFHVASSIDPNFPGLETAATEPNAAATNVDQAFTAANQAIDQHEPQAAFLQTDPRFANLRNDSRYNALLKRLKLRE